MNVWLPISIDMQTVLCLSFMQVSVNSGEKVLIEAGVIVMILKSKSGGQQFLLVLLVDLYLKHTLPIYLDNMWEI